MKKLFKGITLKAISTVSDMPEVAIDRARVEAYKTVLGDTQYIVTGSLGNVGESWPLSSGYDEFEKAWSKKLDIDKMISEAKRNVSPFV